jgi:outer membrane protein TolC
MRISTTLLAALLGVKLGATLCHAQTPSAEPGPLKIDLTDALARARKVGLQTQGAQLAQAIAHEDVRQAKAARLPSVNAFNQFVYTEGNGTPSGVFVGADGVHVYNEQAQVHQELLSLARRGELRAAQAAEAAARARVAIAARGLTATVAQAYYAVVVAARKVANAETSLKEAQNFLDLTQKQEKGGEVAHVDTIKAQIQALQRQRDLDDARLNVDKAKIGLAVLIFPQLREDFTVVDDLDNPPPLSDMPEIQSVARSSSPDIQAAKESLRAATLGVGVARYGYLPSFSLDFFYGLNANQLAAHSTDVEDSGRSTQPNFIVPFRQNLGYQAQATLNIPVWNWGATRSKVLQADLRRRQAELDVTQAQRTLESNLQTGYREARAAQAQLASLRTSLDLSADNLRLTLLRYQAGESTALEVVDAQTTLTQARNAYSDGLARYRVALANLQTLTGTL